MITENTSATRKIDSVPLPANLFYLMLDVSIFAFLWCCLQICLFGTTKRSNCQYENGFLFELHPD